MNKENRVIEKVIKEDVEPYLDDLSSEKNVKKLKASIDDLLTKIDIHYSKKENLMFPYLEKYGNTAPPQVMWGVDDEIRAAIKEVRQILDDGIEAKNDFIAKVNEVIEQVNEMIFKEENILTPMLAEKLTQDEWITIKEESGEIGLIIDKVPDWNPTKKVEKEVKKEVKEKGVITFQVDILLLKNLLYVNALPIDITFIDKGYSKILFQGKERIFARTKAILGVMYLSAIHQQVLM